MQKTTSYVYVPTTQKDWTRSDEYHNHYLIGKDEVLEAAMKHCSDSGLPDIAVSECEGKFLHLLVRSLGVKRILEVGTLGGYSTIWLARGLPEDGSLVTLELMEKYAQVARENVDRAGVGKKVDIIVGPAAESMANLQPDGQFDFIFIDADKKSYVTYFKEAKRLVRKGGIIVVDNVVWCGRVADPEVVGDVNVDGLRDLLKYISEDKEVDSSSLGIVGQKGYDGFLYAIRL